MKKVVKFGGSSLFGNEKDDSFKRFRAFDSRKMSPGLVVAGDLTRLIQ